MVLIYVAIFYQKKEFPMKTFLFLREFFFQHQTSEIWVSGAFGWKTKKKNFSSKQIPFYWKIASVKNLISTGKVKKELSKEAKNSDISSVLHQYESHQHFCKEGIDKIIH